MATAEKTHEEASATKVGGDPAHTQERSPVPKPVIAFFAALRKIFGKAEDEREVIHKTDAVSHKGSWHLRASVEPDELDGGYVAECLDVPGAMAQGETEEEALENLIDAINEVVRARMEAHLDTLDLGDPSTTGRVVDICV